MEKKEAPADIEQPQSPLPVASSILEMISELPPLSPKCCIYRVSPHVRNLNKKVYAPQVVAIGPFHHGEPKLQRMEEHKLRYLQAFLRRFPHNLSLKDCENKIREWEKEIRDSYDETFDLTCDDFVKMVLIDSCFVIEAIISDRCRDRKFYLPKENFLYDIDMMLLENQLPFFVLDRLYHLAFPHEPKTMFLDYCTTYFFYDMLIQVDEDELITKVKDYVVESSHQILHLVDLLRVCLLPSKLRPISDEKSNIDLVTIPKVTEIQESGIELKKSSTVSPLDIKYESAVLEIPQVVVGETTEYLLSNILALEMSHYLDDSYVRDYVFFMDMLIDTPKDVDLLIQNGIISTWTGDSSSVANLFNQVGYNYIIINSNYYFYSASRDLKEYCKRRRHRWKAAFKRDYCSTPWRIASTTAAVILLVLTFIQTISSIRSF